jgi:uncharacterized protein YbjT (DUF2867 family)
MKKKVLITGSTGMVGSLLLQLCLKSDQINEVVSLVRKKTGIIHEKLNEVIIDDFLHYDQCIKQFQDVEIVFYCLGVYTGAVPEKEFRMITVDYPIALAKSLINMAPDASFCLLSGQGADRSEKSKLMFARDKGAVENQLSTIGFKSFHSFRPGYIYPSIPRKEPNIGYTLSRLFYPLIKLFGNNLSVTSEKLAAAMLEVGIHGYSKEILENKEIRSL